MTHFYKLDAMELTFANLLSYYTQIQRVSRVVEGNHPDGKTHQQLIAEEKLKEFQKKNNIDTKNVGVSIPEQKRLEIEEKIKGMFSKNNGPNIILKAK